MDGQGIRRDLDQTHATGRQFLEMADGNKDALVQFDELCRQVEVAAGPDDTGQEIRAKFGEQSHLARATLNNLISRQGSVGEGMRQTAEADGKTDTHSAVDLNQTRFV